MEDKDDQNNKDYTNLGRLLSFLGSYIDPSTVSMKTGIDRRKDTQRVFICVQFPHEERFATNDYGFKILVSIYSELNLIPAYLRNVYDIDKLGASSEDIAISYMRGTEHSCTFSPNKFPGKMIVFSGEPHSPSVHGERVLYLGSDPDGPNSIRIPYVAMLTAQFDRSHNSKHYRDKSIFYHDKKPKNTKEMFLIYAASNCKFFREDAFDTIAARITMLSANYAGGCKGKVRLENKVKC